MHVAKVFHTIFVSDTESLSPVRSDERPAGRSGQRCHVGPTTLLTRSRRLGSFCSL